MFVAPDLCTSMHAHPVIDGSEGWLRLVPLECWLSSCRSDMVTLLPRTITESDIYYLQNCNTRMAKETARMIRLCRKVLPIEANLRSPNMCRHLARFSPLGSSDCHS